MMGTGHVIAIDAGTTGVRAFAIDESGTPIGWAYREFPQYFPRPGWVEHDALEIWAAVQGTLGELAHALPGPVAAIGISNQRETVVAWSRSTGAPRGRAIVWQDRRTAETCDGLLADGLLSEVRQRTGLVLDPYFSATKIGWWVREGIVADDEDLAVGTIDSWLIWQLTGGRADAGARHMTDVSNASRTMLFDIREGAWSEDLCDKFGVPRRALAEVRPSSGRVGLVAAGATALSAGIPISGIAGDQQSALFGQACFTEGMTKNTYGTGSFVLMNVGTVCPEPADGLLTTVAWSLGDGPLTYALEGSIFATGAAVQWLRDGLGVIENAADVEALAASVTSTDGVYIVPAFAGLGSPYWDPYARGTIVGLTRGSTKAHLARAVLEAMAFQTRDVVSAMAVAGGRSIAELRVDGGAAANELMLQLQADQLGVPVTRPAVSETTALGAALLAGLAEGIWGSLGELAECWQADRTFHAVADRAACNDAYDGWGRAVQRSRGWAR